MKNILTLFLFLLFSHFGYAQEHKGTGGAYYTLHIVSIDSAIDDSCLKNGKQYFVEVVVEYGGFDYCIGDIVAKLGSLEVGRLKNRIEGQYAIPITFSVLPGDYTLTCVYGCGWDWDPAGGYRSPTSTKKVTVLKNNAAIDRSYAYASDNNNYKPTIYPQPTTDMLTIKMPVPHIIHEIKITNMNGQILSMLKPDSFDAIIPTKNIPSGVYIMLIQTDNQLLTEKITIAH